MRRFARRVTPTGDLGDLSELYLPPIYDSGDTHLPISDQADALEWLIGQIVKKEPTAQIDLIGFSLGGILASYWGSHEGVTSPLRNHLHGIVTIESPLGGIPRAADCVPTNYLKGICDLMYYKFGKNIIRELQLPGTLTDSIVDELPVVTNNFYFTSIQSTTDYTVNGLDFPITFTDNLITTIYKSPIGRGSQDWGDFPQHLHMDQGLGGLGFANSPKFLVFGLGGAFDFQNSEAAIWITDNHSAPLSSTQTANWIIEAIQTIVVPPTGQVSISAVNGQILENPANGGNFTATPNTVEIFHQTFPVINFNPPVDKSPVAITQEWE